MKPIDNWLDVLNWYHHAESEYILFDYKSKTYNQMKGFSQRCKLKLKIETINGYIKVIRQLPTYYN